MCGLVYVGMHLAMRNRTVPNRTMVVSQPSSHLKFRMIRSTPSFATFESIAFTLSSGNSTVAVLLMYRPGSQMVTNGFFNE